MTPRNVTYAKLEGAIVGGSFASPPPPPAPSLTWTGPTSGTVAVPSDAFTAALVNGTAPVVVTPTASPAGVWTPTTRTLSPGTPSGTFTLTPAATGAHTIGLANNAGIAAPASLAFTAAAASPPPPPPPPPPPAPSLTWAGPSSGTVGVESSDFTATLVNGSGSVVVTPSSSASATFNPTSRTLTPGAPAGTFRMTALAAAMHSVSLANGAGITAPPAVSYTASPAPTPPSPPPPAPASADWAGRSTGAGVVWAHRFDSDAEVTQHLMGSTDPTEYPVPVRRVVDESGIGCLEQIVLGATLAADYTAGAATMQIDDATYWPDPAVTGSFSFIVAKAYPSATDKNLFLCTARSGTTLTVSRVPRADSAFAATAQSYPAGSYAGNENSREWRRVFAALPAGENGLATDDPAASGAVPLRSRLSGNGYSVPRDASLWQYGWYGHPNNQATWANWTGWQGATTLTPRGTAQGASPRFRLWDGQEFFVQFRLKVDARFMARHAQPADGENYWIRKTFAFQSEVSCLQQLVVDMGPSNRWYIPTTKAMPFILRTYKDTKVIGYDDTPSRAHKSFQLGSPWDVAPYYADLSSSYKPSTGLATPDGSTAWEHKDDEWVTFYIRCKPGRSGVAETELEVKFARQDSAGYDGTYTTLLNCTDATIVYSGSGDYDYPDGAFSYPTVQRMDALPGYQAFGLMGYLNLFQAATWVPPKASYYLRMTEVIFSQAPIAPPTAPAAVSWAATVPLTVAKLPSAVTAGSFALLASGSRSLDFYGGFVGHQGTVYMPLKRAMWYFGAETHSDPNYYTNSPRHIALDTMTVYRDLAEDAAPGAYRLDGSGVPYANSAKTRPWAQHAMRQLVRVSSTEWVLAYPTTEHANYFGSTAPIFEGGVTSVGSYRRALWFYNVNTATWRCVDGGASNANIATFVDGAIGYGIAYNPSRGSLMGIVNGFWKELNLTTFARESSSVVIGAGGYNTYCMILDSGIVLAGAGGIGSNTTLFALVDPANPAAFTSVSKSSVPMLAGYSAINTPWAKLPSGKVVGFLKDQTANQLRAFIYDPAANTWADTGHTLSVGAVGVSDGTYWQQCDYADEFGLVILSSNINDTLSVWAYKPSAGV